MPSIFEIFAVIGGVVGLGLIGILACFIFLYFATDGFTRYN